VKQKERVIDVKTKLSPTEQKQRDFYFTVKDLSTPDLSYRLGMLNKRSRELFDRENRLLAEIRDIRAEDKVLALQHGVMTDILEHRR